MRQCLKSLRMSEVALAQPLSDPGWLQPVKAGLATGSYRAIGRPTSSAQSCMAMPYRPIDEGPTGTVKLDQGRD